MFWSGWIDDPAGVLFYELEVQPMSLQGLELDIVAGVYVHEETIDYNQTDRYSTVVELSEPGENIIHIIPYVIGCTNFVDILNEKPEWHMILIYIYQ